MCSVCVCVCVCVCVRLHIVFSVVKSVYSKAEMFCACAHMHPGLEACGLSCYELPIHAYMCGVHVRVCVCVCVHACMCVCMRACVYMCVFVHVVLFFKLEHQCYVVHLSSC